MQFGETWEWLLKGSPHTGKLKTQTRRLVKPNYIFEEFLYDYPQTYVLTPTRKVVYATHHRHLYDKGFCVQPGRGKRMVWWRYLGKIQTIYDADCPKELLQWSNKALVHDGWQPLKIEIYQIKLEDIRTISQADAEAEGFSWIGGFFHTWTKLYDKKAHDYINTLPFVMSKFINRDHLDQAYRDYLFSRPDKFYQAYAIRFERMKRD